MNIFESPAGPIPDIPDDLIIPQFILDSQHPIRPKRPQGTPWLVADKSGKSLDLEEIQRRTNGLTLGLKEKYSVGDGDVVLFFCGNHIDYTVCMWAVHRLLGIVTPCNPVLTVPELVQHIKLSNATLFFVYDEFLPTVTAATAKLGISQDRIIVLSSQDTDKPRAPTGFVGLHDLIHHGLQSGGRIPEVKLKRGEAKTRIAFLSSSSGTTGPPKMVKISHYAFIADILLIAAHNQVSESSTRYTPGDACLAVLPFYHIYGLTLITHFNMFSGISVVVVPKFHFKDMLESIVRHKITSLMVVPPQVVLLVKDPIVKGYDLSSVKVVLCAAAPLPDELYEQLMELMPWIYIGQAYGATEVTGVATMCPVHHKRGRYAGVLSPGVSGRVVKVDGTDAGRNEEGELLIRTPAAASGYHNNDAATRETFSADGWIRSGDLVKIDDNDEIIVVDRLKEMIKVKGLQVAPAELEGCILDHPYAADACVVAAPHTYSGEVPVAFVVPTAAGRAVSANSFKSTIFDHIKTNKAPFKRLYHVEIVQSVPKTPSGKLLRRELRDAAKKFVKPESRL
ncbi:amp dependent CoA ligase [Cylindrobasidium torrendii FP15055 ss-10]|uniref:Amp dependent CoA ligase n=1 Tax=Cylindrobasidium torrendii FP15055 ss-10 TaxID=1314674 RepID=A0A0D7BQT9_9AGAR|nr:amp dependent CoA ligase [Cylindrobasidium torrendii FP15055 ss-10]